MYIFAFEMSFQPCLLWALTGKTLSGCFPSIDVLFLTPSLGYRYILVIKINNLSLQSIF